MELLELGGFKEEDHHLASGLDLFDQLVEIYRHAAPPTAPAPVQLLARRGQSPPGTVAGWPQPPQPAKAVKATVRGCHATMVLATANRVQQGGPTL